MQNSTFYLQPIDDIKAAFISDLSSPAFKVPNKKIGDESRQYPRQVYLSFSGGRVIPQREKHARRVRE